MLSLEPIRQAILRRPFVPFQIRSSDGTQYEVKHPECAAILNNGRTMVVAHGPEDGAAFLDVMLVSSIVYPQGTGGSTQRGEPSDPEPPSGAQSPT